MRRMPVRVGRMLMGRVPVRVADPGLGPEAEDELSTLLLLITGDVVRRSGGVRERRLFDGAVRPGDRGAEEREHRVGLVERAQGRERARRDVVHALRGEGSRVAARARAARNKSRAVAGAPEARTLRARALHLVAEREPRVPVSLDEARREHGGLRKAGRRSCRGRRRLGFQKMPGIGCSGLSQGPRPPIGPVGAPIVPMWP